MYGGIEFLNSLPINWNQILDKIDEQREERHNQSP